MASEVGSYENPIASDLFWQDENDGLYRIIKSDRFGVGKEVFVVSSEEEITTTKDGLYIVVEE